MFCCEDFRDISSESILHEDDPICISSNVHVVRCDQNCDVVVIGKLMEQLGEAQLHLSVDSRRQLVTQKYFGLLQKSSC